MKLVTDVDLLVTSVHCTLARIFIKLIPLYCNFLKQHNPTSCVFALIYFNGATDRMLLPIILSLHLPI